jgi:hypothetical protein
MDVCPLSLQLRHGQTYVYDNFEVLKYLKAAMAALPLVESLVVVWLGESRLIAHGTESAFYLALHTMWSMLAPQLRTLRLELGGDGLAAAERLSGNIAIRLRSLVVEVTYSMTDLDMASRADDSLARLSRTLIASLPCQLASLRVCMHARADGAPHPQPDAARFFAPLQNVYFPELRSLDITTPFRSAQRGPGSEGAGVQALLAAHAAQLESCRVVPTYTYSFRDAFATFQHESMQLWSRVSHVTLWVPLRDKRTGRSAFTADLDGSGDGMAQALGTLGACGRALRSLSLSGRFLDTDELRQVLGALAGAHCLRRLLLNIECLRPGHVAALAHALPELDELHVQVHGIAGDDLPSFYARADVDRPLGSGDELLWPLVRKPGRPQGARPRPITLDSSATTERLRKASLISTVFTSRC